MSETPEQLRERARQIRDSAMRADRLSDARHELQQAARLERQADEMEGLQRPLPKVVTAKPCPKKRAALDKAIADIEARYGPKR